MNDKLTRLNCMNYHVSDSDNEHWFAQNGLRSLYTYSKLSNITFKELCLQMIDKGQVIVKDLRDNNNDQLIISMI